MTQKYDEDDFDKAKEAAVYAGAGLAAGAVIALVLQNTMQRILQSTKKLISICLVTLLLVISTLTISPAPAKADIVLVKCESDCTVAFTVGMVAGSAVTLAANGSGVGLAGAGTTAVVDTAVAAAPFAASAVPLATAAVAAAADTAIAATFTALAVAAAAPVVVPIAIGTTAISGAYLLWRQFSQPSTH